MYLAQEKRTFPSDGANKSPCFSFCHFRDRSSRERSRGDRSRSRSGSKHSKSRSRSRSPMNGDKSPESKKADWLNYIFSIKLFFLFFVHWITFENRQYLISYNFRLLIVTIKFHVINLYTLYQDSITLWYLGYQIKHNRLNYSHYCWFMANYYLGFFSQLWYIYILAVSCAFFIIIISLLLFLVVNLDLAKYASSNLSNSCAFRQIRILYSYLWFYMFLSCSTYITIYQYEFSYNNCFLYILPKVTLQYKKVCDVY